MYFIRFLILALVSSLLLSSCGNGAVRRVSAPAVRIQQLTVHPDGGWSLDLRLQNYSSIPMQFDRITLDIAVAGQTAGKLDQAIGLSIGPETADAVTLTLHPSSLARMAVANTLASGSRLPYTLQGMLWATPQGKTQRNFPVNEPNWLNPAPGLAGVLR